MITFIPIKHPHVVGIRINGKIAEQEMDSVLNFIDKKLQNHSKVNIYVELESFGGIPPNALYKELKFGLGNIQHFGKEAVVTDKKWIEKLAPAADKLFTGIEIKTFSFDEKNEARNWVQ